MGRYGKTYSIELDVIRKVEAIAGDNQSDFVNEALKAHIRKYRNKKVKK